MANPAEPNWLAGFFVAPRSWEGRLNGEPKPRSAVPVSQEVSIEAGGPPTTMLPPPPMTSPRVRRRHSKCTCRGYLGTPRWQDPLNTFNGSGECVDALA